MSSDPSTVAVGRQLKQRREDLDITQEELGERIGITSTTVSAIERGRNEISRGKRPDWEGALRLKAGTITRAYREGAPIEPAASGDVRRNGRESAEDIAAENRANLEELSAILERALEARRGKRLTETQRRVTNELAGSLERTIDALDEETG